MIKTKGANTYISEVLCNFSNQSKVFKWLRRLCAHTASSLMDAGVFKGNIHMSKLYLETSSQSQKSPLISISPTNSSATTTESVGEWIEAVLFEGMKLSPGRVKARFKFSVRTIHGSQMAFQKFDPNC